MIPHSSEIIVLPLFTVLAPALRQMSSVMFAGVLGGFGPVDVAAALDDLLLVFLEIEVEVGQDVVLDVAGLVAQVVEFGEFVAGGGAFGDEAVAAAAQRELEVLVVERAAGVGLERGGGGFVEAHAGSPMAGVSRSPASTSTT